MTHTDRSDEISISYTEFMDCLFVARADERRKTAKTFGACMSCLDGSPDPMGCIDCLGTGYDGGAPVGFVSEKTHEALVAEATLAATEAERERCAKVLEAKAAEAEERANIWNIWFEKGARGTPLRQDHDAAVEARLIARAIRQSK